MSSSTADPRVVIPPPRAHHPTPEPAGSRAWQQLLARAADTWAMALGAPVSPSLTR